MKRTVYINMRFMTQRITGVQRFAFEMCKALDALYSANSNVEVIGLMPSCQIQEQYSNYSFNSIRVKSCGRLSGHLWEQLELPWYSTGCLLVNLCNTAPLFKLKQCVTLHDVIFMTNQDSQKLWFKLWYCLIARVTSLSARIIFTVSQFSKSEIIRTLKIKANRIIVLGNAPSLQNYSYMNDVFTRFGLSDKKYFLVIGSSSIRKNTQIVTNLFASDPELRETILVIVGGKYINLTAIDDIVANNIIYTGYVEDGELRSLYRNAQALIFPSLYEGFGIPVIEAMSEHTPVIVANIPVLHEVCIDGALYFDPHDATALKSILLQVTSNQRVVDDLNKSATLRMSNYKWTKFAKIMEEIIIKNI